MNTYICVALQKNMLFIIKGKDNIMFSHLPLWSKDSIIIIWISHCWTICW